MTRTLFIATCLSLAACGGAPAQTDDFSGLAGSDQKADAFSNKMKIIGSLGYDSSMSFTYHNPPRYLALTFQGQVDDGIETSVSSDRHPMVWLLDQSFRTLARSAEVDDNGVDTIIMNLKESGLHYIVVRDASLADSKFSVHLKGTPAANPCFPVPHCEEGLVWNPTLCQCEFGDGT